MKKILTFLSICSLLLSVSFSNAQAVSLSDKLKGWILLQVEAHGEAWYVDAVSGQRFYLGRPSDAFAVMRQLGLGVSDADFEKIKKSVPARLAGRILLKVQDKGQAYYIDPVSLKLNYLGRPSDAFSVMRSLGMGISSKNLEMIAISAKSIAVRNGSDGKVVPEKATTTKDVEAISPVTPSIVSIKAENGKDKGYIDAGDVITVTFSEAIDPKSLNGNLEKGSYVNNAYYYSTGGVSILQSGLLTIRNVATFDVGAVEKNSDFSVKLALDFSGKVLAVTLTNGIETAIINESFSGAAQVGGTLKDANGNALREKVAGSLSGTFGGSYDENSGTPFITAIRVDNNGSGGYISIGDRITVTFNEAIDPLSLNGNLAAGGSVNEVPYSSTGGVSVSSAGKVTIKNVATFDMGSVANSGLFTSQLALNSSGKILTISLTGGSDIAITAESFSGANQTGATVKDIDGREMATIIGIANPSGSFGGEYGDFTGSPYIASIKVLSSGSAGYVDAGDSIVIGFSEGLDPASINENLESGSYISGVPGTATGGVSVSTSGVVTVRNIVSFDLGSVADSGSFTVKLSLDQSGKTLTASLTGGTAVLITSESFGNAAQASGTIKDVSGTLMAGDPNLAIPSGTFGGVSSDGTGVPFITAIDAIDSGSRGYIDIGDVIKITFNEAIDPGSINSGLSAGAYVADVPYSSTGGVSVSSSGLVIIRNIATFDLGSVPNSGSFTAKLALDQNSRVLTVTLTGGNDVAVSSESLGSATQLSGTIKDIYGNRMASVQNACYPSGTFAN